jgi:uncharacterized repeat protein (TIGR03803 family)
MRLVRRTLRRAQILVVALATLGLVPIAWGGAKYKVLHNFGSSMDGTVPTGPLLLDEQGNLYGVTGGGPGQYGYGIAFELTPHTNGKWKEAILHAFAAGSDGAIPWGGLIFDNAGDLYGTMRGDSGLGGSGVFELSQGSGGWINTVLYSDFAGPGLVIDNLGNLYGEIGRGQYKYGAIAELSPGLQAGGWVYTPLYSFCSQYCPDGWGLAQAPIWDRKGNLYGATVNGGNGPPKCTAFGECGVIFKMMPKGDGTWAYHVLHRFASFPTDGESPNGGLVMDASGNLYGVTVYGGAYNRGIVFKLTFAGGHWKETTLYDFPNCADGCYPAGTPAFDKAGNLYATASGGLGDCGGFTCGVVFKLSPQQNGTWKYSVVYKLHGTDGNFLPYGVIVDSRGNIFGTTSAGGTYNSGVAFEITP